MFNILAYTYIYLPAWYSWVFIALTFWHSWILSFRLAVLTHDVILESNLFKQLLFSFYCNDRKLRFCWGTCTLFIVLCQYSWHRIFYRTWHRLSASSNFCFWLLLLTFCLLIYLLHFLFNVKSTFNIWLLPISTFGIFVNGIWLFSIWPFDLHFIRIHF